MAAEQKVSLLKLAYESCSTLLTSFVRVMVKAVFSASSTQERL
jgi:hypothetical protein